MNFKFYPKESRLYDFLRLPRLLFYKESITESEWQDYLKDINMAEYLDYVGRVEDKLNPFIKDIEVFYTKPFINDYNFIDLVTQFDSFFGYKDERDYLDYLLTLTEDEINENIIYSLMIEEEDIHTHSEELRNKAREISSSQSHMLSFIKNLSIDAALKWNLFLYVEEPILYMKKYVDLMLKLLPIFNAFYKEVEEKVIDYGAYLMDYLNKHGAKGLSDITYSILDAKVLNQDDINLLISVNFSYAISLMSMSKKNYLAWGLKMEDAFRQMKENNENKINERVQIFKNLGDKTRYDVLRLIASGETSVKEIAKVTGVSSATISYHLNNLLTSKIIKMDRIENKYGYVVDYDLLNRTIEELKEDLKFYV